MDFRVKKSCPNCSQYFTSPSEEKISKVSHSPLTLQCGHPICQKCLTNIIKFNEPIKCKICGHKGQLASMEASIIMKNPNFIYKTFPIHIQMLGELSLKMENTKTTKNCDDSKYFVDVRATLDAMSNSFAECMECNKRTNKMCKNCNSVLCETCFSQIHSNFQSFKNHVLINIVINLEPNTCITHDKPVNYYCMQCSKMTCVDCLMVFNKGEGCKDHHLTPIAKMHEKFAEELKAITPKVDETLRRLSNTGVEIGHILKSLEHSKTTEVSNLILDVQYSFSKLYALLQKHEHETICALEKMKIEQRDSLFKAKDNVICNLKTVQSVLQNINAALNTGEDIGQINIMSILEMAKTIDNIPWYLIKHEKESKVKVSFKDELCDQLQQYVTIEGESLGTYELLSTSEIPASDIPPAPRTIVYPPELPRDVREAAKVAAKTKQENELNTNESSVPKFKPKFGSMNSLNSAGSNKSYNTEQKRKSDTRENLKMGTQELVYISHIINPHNFYIQRAANQCIVKELIKTFRSSDALSMPISSDIVEGKYMLAYCQEEEKWYRCKIISIAKNYSGVYEVFYIDYGITDHVTLDQLRELSPENIKNPPPLAFNCKLANLEPIKKEWTIEDAFLMQKVVDNKQSVLFIRGVKKNRYICDLVTFEEGVNLALAFVFHERGRLVNQVSYPPIKTIEEKPRIFYSTLEYNSKNDLLEVFITSVTNPDRFFVRKMSLLNTYLDLSQELASAYSLKNQKNAIHCPFEGMVCVVNVDDYDEVAGGGWRRARVRKLSTGQKVMLQLIDTGEPLVAHVSSLKKIHSQFTTLNALAVECQLNGVTPLNKKWSDNSLKLLYNFARTKLQMRVIQYNRYSLSVILYGMSENNEFLCINQEMVRKRFAITMGITDFNLPEECIYTNDIPVNKKRKEHKQNAITILSRHNNKKLIEPVSNEVEAKDKGPIKLEVIILSCQSPSLIYVALKDQQKKMKEIYAELQEYYSKETDTKSDWKVDDKCCAICTESKTWRRARVTEVKDDKANLMFVDFAITEEVALSDLRVLATQFESERDAALKCYLSGIMPGAGDNWPLLTIQHLKDRLKQYSRFFITKKGTVKDNSLPIELWVYHITQGSALEPNKAEWRCLNNDIINNGLGIPDRTNDPPKLNEGDDDSLSFLDLTGSVNDWILHENMLNDSSIEFRDEQESPTAVDGGIPDNINIIIDQNGSENVDISKWLPPEPFKSSKCCAFVTHVDSAGVLYVHEEAQKSTLQLIRGALEKHLPKGYTEPIPGALCLAKFYADNQWYRGVVLTVRPMDVTVVFVDYGNHEVCSRQDVLVLTERCALHRIPVQAHPCVLAHIRPATGVSWSTTSLEYIHQIIVEKNTTIQIVGEPIGDCIPIELKLEDKFWLHEHLVEFDLALEAKNWRELFTRNWELVVTASSETEYDYIASSDSEIEAFNDTSEYFDRNVDWNTMLDEDDEELDSVEQINIPKYLKVTLEKKSYPCIIPTIHSLETLYLKLYIDTNLDAQYDEMEKDMQSRALKRPKINGIYKNKACIALFSDNDCWYRASVLEYDEEIEKVKVQYVDYGNTEITHVTNVREIHVDWLKLPPATIAAKIFGCKTNLDFDKEKIAKAFSETFLNKVLEADIIECNEKPILVNLKDDNGESIHNNLIECGIFILDL